MKHFLTYSRQSIFSFNFSISSSDSKPKPSVAVLINTAIHFNDFIELCFKEFFSAHQELVALCIAAAYSLGTRRILDTLHWTRVYGATYLLKDSLVEHRHTFMPTNN